MNGIIVGIDNINGRKGYRVVLYNKGDMKSYQQKLFDEASLIRFISSGNSIDNADVENNKIVASSGEFKRFEAKGFRPMVVISEIRANDNVVGYRLASYEGKVSACRLKDAIAYCNRVSKHGYPFQNAIFVGENGENRAYIKSYPGKPFNIEVIQRKRAENVTKAKVDKTENSKQVSRIEELFTKEQIEQLKLGKQHGVDIRIYGNNKLSAEQMKELRKALEDKVNARLFADPKFSADTMNALRINAKYGVDLTYFINPNYNPQQIFELSTGYINGVDISQYADPELSALDMSKKRVYMESQLWKEIEAEKVS